MQHDGTPVTLGVGQDVTDRHLAETQIKESLAREAAAREAIAAANAGKERFIATLAHELRTPLNAAMGWFHILKGIHPAAAGEKATESIDRNLHMMQTLIEDIVDFNRAEYGKLTLQKVRVDPASLIGDVVASMRSLAAQKQIGIAEDIPPGLPAIQADPKRVRQIMLNILGNALKFTQPGGEVRITAGVHLSGGVTVTIADDGPGIAPEHLTRMFEPLWQPRGGERTDGLGLGLALVKRLVDAHGGTVRIDSDGLNRGTTVTVMLPVDAAEQDEVAV
jgi:signal transduction histidine kinase